MPNGFFLSYKRRRTRKEKGSRAEGTKCCQTDSGRFSLYFALLFLLCRFRGGSRCFEERPCASGSTSGLLSPLRRNEQASASVRRPVRL